jgi:hypothetical protein
MSEALKRVLDRLGGNVKRRASGGYEALCPAHEDRRPSLSITEGEDGRILLNCFAGCSTEAVVERLGFTMGDLYEYRNGRGEGEGESIPSKESPYVDTGCTVEDYAKAKELPTSFLTKTMRLSDMHYVGAPAVRIPYMNECGEEVCVRFRVSLDGSPKIKTRRGDKHILYGLWLLDRIRSAGKIVLVEGESDTHTLWYHGFPALGVPGANSWKSEWSEKLDGIERIYVVVEPDAAGEGLWERLTASPLRERLYRVELDGFKDVSELHLDGPEDFVVRFEQALVKATSFMDIAETEAQERAREAWALCEGLAREEHILDCFAADLRRCGVAGETKAAKLIFLALNSRHLPARQLVNVVVKGPSSAGKTYVVEKVCSFFPEEAYHFLTGMSERALAYSEEPLSHRFLVLAEAAGMSGEVQNYLIRSLLSEGRLRYETVEKTSEGLKPRIIEREGPTGLIITTTRTRLHGENETRLLTVRVDDTPEHTKEILVALADEDGGSLDASLEKWRALQVWIDGGEKRVTIPYAKRLARKIPPVAVRLRRDFEAILNLIRSHALLHRATRERDERGRVVATVKDYAVVRELVADLIGEGAEATVPHVVRETVETTKRLLEISRGEPLTIKDVGDELELDYQPTYRRVQMALEGGYLRNLEERERRPARLVMGDPLPEDRQILPDPKELEDDAQGVFAY